MADRWVVDASVVGAAFFNEARSDEARVFLATYDDLIAPDLLFAEIASLSAKKVWRGEADETAARRAVRTLRQVVAEFIGGAALAETALALSARHRFSAYDAFYLSLAEARGLQLVTFDEKLIDRANAAGLGGLVTQTP
jgi:predicted nucleic acid-binding protein